MQPLDWSVGRHLASTLVCGQCGDTGGWHATEEFIINIISYLPSLLYFAIGMKLSLAVALAPQLDSITTPQAATVSSWIVFATKMYCPTFCWYVKIVKGNILALLDHDCLGSIGWCFMCKGGKTESARDRYSGQTHKPLLAKFCGNQVCRSCGFWLSA